MSREDLAQDLYSYCHDRNLSVNDIINKMQLNVTDELFNRISEYKRTWVGLEQLVDFIINIDNSKPTKKEGVLTLEEIKTIQCTDVLTLHWNGARTVLNPFLYVPRIYKLNIISFWHTPRIVKCNTIRPSISDMVWFNTQYPDNEIELRECPLICCRLKRYGVDKDWYLKKC